MIVLRRFLEDRRRSLIGWSVAIFFVFLLQNAFYPSFKDQPDLSKIFEDLPDTAKALFGISDAVPLSSPPGWLQGQVFSLLPVLVVIFAVSLGARALATSEEDGTLELMLSNPIARLRVGVERLGALVALTVALGVVTCALTLATTPLLQLTEGVSLAGYAAATAGTIALGLLFGSLSFGVGAFTGRRSLALTVAASVAVATYMFNGLASSVKAAHVLRLFSPFHWFLGRNMLAQGIAVEALTLPIAFAGLFAALGLWGFLRRDLQSA